MNTKRDERALRKKVLLARSTLHRLEIRKEWQSIGGALNLSGIGQKAGAPFSVRGWLFDQLLRRIASAPVARLLGLLSGIVSFAQVLRIGSEITRKAQAQRPTGDDVVVEKSAP
jgi:hypothetical protein